MQKVIIIAKKEFLEMIQQRQLLLSVLITGILLAVLPILSISGILPSNSIHGINVTNSNPLVAGLTTEEAIQALPAMITAMLYLLIPTLTTMFIASYSIVGEKNSHTLEPVLATPIRTWELLVGKSLVAFITGVGITWLAGVIFIMVAAWKAIDQNVFHAIVSPSWLIIFLIWTPLLSILSIGIMTIISSRVNDVRAAQQLSALIVLPVVGLFLLQASGTLVTGIVFTILIAVSLAALAVAAVWGMNRLFQREAILTRWK